MKRFRCKICGRVFDSVPRQCDCGNTDTSLWMIVEEDRPAPGTGGTGPATFMQYNGPQQPYAPVDRAPQRQSAGKQSRAVLISVVSVLVLALAVGGFFGVKALIDNGVFSSGDSAQEDAKTSRRKRSQQEENGEEPAAATELPAETTAAMLQPSDAALIPGETYQVPYSTPGGAGINLRSGPGTSYDKVCTVSEGTVFVFTGLLENGYGSVEFYVNDVLYSGWVMTMYFGEDHSGGNIHNGPEAIR